MKEISYRESLALVIYPQGDSPYMIKVAGFDPAERQWRTISNWRNPSDVSEGDIGEAGLAVHGYKIKWTEEELDWMEKARTTSELQIKASELKAKIKAWFNAWRE